MLYGLPGRDCYGTANSDLDHCATRGEDDLSAMGEAQRPEVQLHGMLGCYWLALVCYRSRLLLNRWLHTEAGAV